MPNLLLTNEQAIELIKQLPAERKRSLLVELAQEAAQERKNRMAYAEEQLRQLANQRELDWDRMTEDEKESFVDDLVHEDRQCVQYSSSHLDEVQSP